MQCLLRLVLLLSALLLAVSLEADQSPEQMGDLAQDLQQDLEQDLDMELRHHRLLQRARSAGLLTQRAVEDLLLAQMSIPEADAPRPAISKVTGEHEYLQRSVETPSNKIGDRERKNGCKNFYWKGFTSC